jgi:Na+-translocating ferredoxin:NAD+ oxidoreductase subunit C
MVDIRARHTFHGGAHPPERKAITADKPIAPGPMPTQATIMLSQHIGAPCQAQVKKGDVVDVGQVIGDCEAYVSAPIHTPVAGKIKDVSLQPHPVQGRSLGVVIEVDPDKTPIKEPCPAQFNAEFDVSQWEAQAIQDVVRKAGLVGMGGAGFPTRVKIEPNPRLVKDTMIVNGCECEPYITCDYRIMLEWTYQVLAGIQLVRRASGCKKVVIGIEDNKPLAITAMSDALSRMPNGEGIEVLPVQTKYPQGGERQLINAVTGRHVPSGGIPPMIGMLVINVATAAAVAEAVVCDAPLTHRVVTVTGEAIAKPGNYYTPLGMTVQEMIDFCGGVTNMAAKVVLGGPMMGFALADLSTPLTKTCGAITVLTEKQIGRAKAEGRETPCIRCGRCLEVCPENLNPTKIAHAVKYHALDVADRYYMGACIECGCCSYVCPANIEITGYIKTGKINKAKLKDKA